MKTLNKTSNRIFCALLEKLTDKQHLKIDSECFMPLTIERIGEDVITPFGKVCQYSLCHYYSQMGDLMKDPEMCFMVVDHREGDAKAYEKVKIVPCMFQQDNVGLFEESVLIIDNKIAKYAPQMNAAHAAFANLWLANIRNQGFLK